MNQTNEYTDSNQSNEIDNLHFKHLSPLTIIYFLLRRSTGIIIAAYFAFYKGSAENWVFILTFILFSLLIVPVAIARFFSITYAFNTEFFVFRKGYLNKIDKYIPLEKIININFTQNFIEKILGIAKLEIETAGEQGTEATLECISKKDCELLRDNLNLLIAKKRESKHQTAISDTQNSGIDTQNEQNTIQTEKQVDEEVPIFHLNIREILLFGFLRFRPAIFVVFFFAFSIFSNYLRFLDKGLYNQISNYLENNFQDTNTILFISNVIKAFIIFFVLGWIWEILITFNSYYNFKLFKKSKNLISNQGLLKSARGSINLRKIQIAIIKTNIFLQKLNYYSLAIETAGLSNQVTGKADFALPIAHREKIYSFLNEIGINFEESQLTKPEIKFLVYNLLVTFIFFLVFSSISLLMKLSILPICIFFGLLAIYHFFYYKNYWYTITDSLVIVYRGNFYKHCYIVPIKKFQSIAISQNWLERIFNLSKILIDTAAYSSSSDIKLRGLDINNSNLLKENLEKQYRSHYSKDKSTNEFKSPN